MAEMFPNAAAYETMMGRWSARPAPLFVDVAHVRDGGRLLDVGCGTGSLVKMVADLGRGSEIVGIDPSQPLIDYCRQRFPDPRITFDCGNGMELPYRHATTRPEVAVCDLLGGLAINRLHHIVSRI